MFLLKVSTTNQGSRRRHVNMLRQDKSIGAFVLCNVRLHLEPREGRGGGRLMMKLSYQNKD